MRDAATGDPVRGALVTLVPADQAGLPPGPWRTRPERLRPRQTTGPRGFFQLAGVASGSYRLLVTADGYAPLVLDRIELGAAEELLLGDVDLVRPFEVTVEVDPPVPPEGHLWRVELISGVDPEPGLAGRLAAEADPTGRAALTGVVPGEYFVRLLPGEDAPPVLTRTLRLEHAETVRLEVPLIWVEGVLEVDGRPLQGRVTLQAWGRVGDLRADAEGRFHGWVPDPGGTTVSVRIEATDPPVSWWLRVPWRPGRDRRVELSLSLPGSGLHGTVLNPDGTPAAGAEVVAWRRGGFRARTTAAEDGTYRIPGLREGRWRTGAALAGYASRQLAVEVCRACPPREVTVQLLEGRARRGRVIGPEGPLPFARVTLAEFAAGLLPSATTDHEGRFEVVLHTDPAAVNVVVEIPRQRIWAGRITVPRDGEIVVAVPAGGSGTLRLPGGAETSPPACVVSQEDGVLWLSDLVSWALQLEPSSIPMDAAGRAPLRIPAVSSGLWAAAGPERCEAVLAGESPSLRWKALAPGGELELP